MTAKAIFIAEQNPAYSPAFKVFLFMLKKVIFYFSYIALAIGVVLFFTFKSSSYVFIWQNGAGPYEASFSVLFQKNSKMEYWLEKTPERDEKTIWKKPLSKIDKKYFNLIKPSVKIEKDFSDWAVEHVRIKNLSPENFYQLVVRDQYKTVLSHKIFKTLNLDKPSLTFAIASCMDDGFRTQKKMWTDLLSFNPDMIFLIGDNVYADKYIPSSSLKNFWKRYVETISSLELYRSRKTVPLLAVWDDHDYGMNNGNRDFKYKNEMSFLFRSFFPVISDNKNLIQGPGISFLLKASLQNFFFMDNRSFQSPVKKSEGSLWGKRQEEWLLINLRKDEERKDLQWIINGSQIFGRHHRFESFEKDFPSNFQKMMDEILDLPHIFFLSGDRHLSELLKIEDWKNQTYELVTSPIHASLYPEKHFVKDSRHIYHVSNTFNYALIKSEPFPEGLKIKLSVYGPDKKVLFSKQLIYPQTEKVFYNERYEENKN